MDISMEQLVENLTPGIADYFATNPDTNAVFMLGPAPASAFNRYIHQAAIKPGEVYATTHDTSPEIFQMIQDGYLLQAIDQQPYLQGFQTVISLYLYRQYGMRPSGFINTASVVDQSNVENVIQLGELGYR
jgi:simple sugar transport system substrate-binding protein